MNKRSLFALFIIVIIAAAGVKILFERNLNDGKKVEEDKVAVEYYEDSSGEIKKNFSRIKYKNIDIKIPDEDFIFVRGASFRQADVEFRHYWPNINLGLREASGRFLIKSRLTVGSNIPTTMGYQNFLNRGLNPNVIYERSDINKYENLIRYEEKANNLSWVYVYEEKKIRSKNGEPVFIRCLKDTYIHSHSDPGNACEIVEKYGHDISVTMKFEEENLNNFPNFYLDIIAYFDKIVGDYSK